MSDVDELKREIEALKARVQKLEQGRRGHQFQISQQAMQSMATVPQSGWYMSAGPCAVCGLDYNAPAHSFKNY